MADNDSQLPVRAIATQFTTEVANAAGTTINPAQEDGHLATIDSKLNTLGQKASSASVPVVLASDQSTIPTNLTQVGGSAIAEGQHTMAASIPVVLASDQTDVPVNVDKVGGALLTEGQKTMSASVPVVLASDQTPVNVQFGGVTPVLTYFTDAAVASGATVTHSLAGPVILDKIDCAESGSLKMTVAIGITGSEVVVWNGFTGVPNSTLKFELPHAYTIPTGSSVKVTLKNRDTSALDTYLTFFSH